MKKCNEGIRARLLLSFIDLPCHIQANWRSKLLEQRPPSFSITTRSRDDHTIPDFP